MRKRPRRCVTRGRHPAHVPDVTRLSSAELIEYRAIIGVAIDATDQMIGRFALTDIIVHAILDGVKDESELLVRIRQELAAEVEGR